MTVINAKVRKTRAIARSFIFAAALILGACSAGIVMAKVAAVQSVDPHSKFFGQRLGHLERKSKATL
jgi:hypothetical protein